MATSVTSARVGRDEVTIDSSICVAVITGRASAPARPMMCFWTNGTSSIRSSMPRSPRATITQSDASMTASALSTAWGFSIFAISGMSVCARRSMISSGRRTKLSATRSTPISSPMRRRRMSSSATDGSAASSPGTFRPWREDTRAAHLHHRVELALSRAHLGDPQAHAAVGEVDHLARLERLGQSGPRHRHPALVALLLGAAHDREPLPRLDLGHPAAQRADAQLGSREVLEDRHRPAGPLGGLAHPLGGLRPSPPPSRARSSGAPRPCPASTMRSSVSGSSEAGPIVATILVRRTG